MYLIIILYLVLRVTAQLPDNLQQIYDQHKSRPCNDPIATGFSGGSSDTSSVYCGDLPGAIYLYSTGGGYADMDIDCDGANTGAGACGNDPTGQGQTAFQDQLTSYGISDLDSNVHPYVVFGNTAFDPQEAGMEPLSVMAVVCGGKVVYGIWGDTNGGDLTGEASISLAELCFPGDGMSGDQGHTDNNVMYIGFKGESAVPGDSADWAAGDAEAFEDSIRGLGDQLVAGLSA